MRKNTCPFTIESFRGDDYIYYSPKVCYHKDLSYDTKVFKYFNVDFLVEMFVSKKMYIANRRAFTDRREQGWKEDLKLFFSLKPAGNSKWAREERIRMSMERQYAKELCISCWSKDSHDGCDESYLMWKAYGENRCRIETTLGKLLNSLDFDDNEVVIRPVIYKNESTDYTVSDLVFSKTLEYKDEQEIRICIFKKNNSIELPIKDWSFIKKIRLSPFNSRMHNRLLEIGLETKFDFLKGKIELSHIAEY